MIDVIDSQTLLVIALFAETDERSQTFVGCCQERVPQDKNKDAMLPSPKKHILPLRAGATATLLLLAVALPSAAIASVVTDTGLVPRWPALLVGALAGVVGFLLGRPRTPFAEMTSVGKAGRLVGYLVATLGVYLVAFSATNAPPLYSSEGNLPWTYDLGSAEARSKDEHKVMMVDFTAEWCGACHELEAEVFLQPEVKPRLERDFVLVKVDFDAALEAQAALLQRFEVSGLPRVAFVSPDGKLIKGASFEGKLSKEDFAAKMDAAIAGGGEQESTFAKTLRDEGLLAALILMFFAGFLASLTPCVYPLIPITVSLFGARAAKSRFEALSLSLTYVLGIAITYSLLGVMAASFGTIFGGAMQHPGIKLGLAVLFVVLGLGSLGVLTLRLPGDLQTKLSDVGGAGYLGALLMGLVAGIIAAPCVGPIVAGVLVYVAEQQDLFLGWLMLFVFALGLGVIFVVLGTFSGLIARVPKSGPWMDGVKAFFAIVFFGMALFYLRYLISPIGDVTEAIWLQLGVWLA